MLDGLASQIAAACNFGVIMQKAIRQAPLDPEELRLVSLAAVEAIADAGDREVDRIAFLRGFAEMPAVGLIAWPFLLKAAARLELLSDEIEKLVAIPADAV